MIIEARLNSGSLNKARMVFCVDFGNTFDTSVRGRGQLSAGVLSTSVGGIGYLKAETITPAYYLVHVYSLVDVIVADNNNSDA